MDGNFKEFLQRLERIKRNFQQNELAPHKPVLLLSLADWFEENDPALNRVPIDERLTGLFLENWKLLVHTEVFRPNYLRPLHHLASDGFWQLHKAKGEVLDGYISSLKQYLNLDAYGQFSPEVFRWFRQQETREIIRMHLLDTYFRYTKHIYIAARGMDGFILDIESDILMEPAARYEHKILPLRAWEGFIRDWKFRHAVLSAYLDTCCISGLRVEDATMVEACHILRHADTGNNRINNGLALCPNLHKAFDYGLIGLDDNYTVLVKKDLKESPSAYRLQKLQGRRIQLPSNERLWPSQGYLERHREGWGLG